jgi:class 3 adenylate cyclase/tetratricopeptide (TPR) repeat protein
MVACPDCGEENPDRFRLCGYCGTPLSQSLTGGREERKVVTVLFCDLVGFTTRSEVADPEDVRSVLRTYHGRVKREIERYEGTVEKFIGDAVMAVFGAPVAHEDDAKRAVLAGLAILDAIDELNAADPRLRLAVRIGVNSGETLVDIDAHPERGEGMVAGDVVNTAARVQAGAPVGSVVVGAATYRATERSLQYQELEPMMAKGKAEPIPVWRAIAPRFPGMEIDVMRFVGREAELSLLQELFDRTGRKRRLHIATIVGEAGVGKSRLLSELRAQVADTEERPVRWYRGHCLPYGEGATFWGLGQIVKSRAGILDSDDGAAAAEKLERVLPPDEPERDWMIQRLRPLVGLDAPAPAAQQESFAAWRRFLECLSSEGPVALVFEDLHWADDAMLQFIDHLRDRVEGFPMTVLATARPDLFANHPSWTASAPNATRIDLSPLSEREAATLIESHLGGGALPAEVQSLILQRTQGNPLFTEEYLRLFKDRGLLRREESQWAIDAPAGIPLPEGIQAVIAARLDSLAPNQKSIMTDAAVLGQVFWVGGVAQMNQADRSHVELAMQELSRRQLVRQAGASSLSGETEYGFWHVLIRDVTYSQIPRAARAEKHLAAASWIEGVAAQRVGDFAEIIASHYTAAMNLLRVIGQQERARTVEEPALRFLLLAGDRAMALDVARAEGHYRQALELAPRGHERRGAVLGRLAEAVRLATGNLAEAAHLYEKALEEYEAAENTEGAVDLQLRLSQIFDYLGDQARARSLLEDVIERLESKQPTAQLAMAYAHLAFPERGAPFSEGIAWADRAIALADKLHLPAVRARALGTRGISLANLGDPKSVPDLRVSLALSMELGLDTDTYITYHNLIWALNTENPSSALELADEALSLLRTRGLAEGEALTHAYRLETLFLLGRWDELLAKADEIIAEAKRSTNWHIILTAAISKAWVLSLRGSQTEAGEFADDLCAGRKDRWLYALAIPRIRGRRASGRSAEAARLVEDTIEALEAEGTPLLEFLGDMARETIAIGRADLLLRCGPLSAGGVRSARHGRQSWKGLWAEANERYDEAFNNFTRAERGWAKFGNPYERAQALVGQARCLLALERSAEAITQLGEARETFSVLGAGPALHETDSLLRRATTLTSRVAHVGDAHTAGSGWD